MQLNSNKNQCTLDFEQARFQKIFLSRGRSPVRIALRLIKALTKLYKLKRDNLSVDARPAKLGSKRNSSSR